MHVHVCFGEWGGWGGEYPDYTVNIQTLLTDETYNASEADNHLQLSPLTPL